MRRHAINTASLQRPPGPAHSPQALCINESTFPKLGTIVDAAFHPASVRTLLHRHLTAPGLTTRLDFCTEFTKPDSLKIRMMGTPKNHRSPPV